jgi:hypothetical protein
MDIVLTLHELSTAVGLSPARLARLARLGLIESSGPEPYAFTAATAVLLRRMLRLRRDLHVNLHSAAIIMDLVERLDGLERSWPVEAPSPIHTKPRGDRDMDPNRLTEKAQEAIRQAQSSAQRQGQSQIEGGASGPRAARPGRRRGRARGGKGRGYPATLTPRLQQALDKLPRVSGPGASSGQVYVSPRVERSCVRPRPRPSA